MRIVIALGGNAILRRGQPMTADNQRTNIRAAAEHIASVAEGNEVVIAHGNGPQVGLLALQAAAYQDVEPYPLDVLGAQTEAMIGYVIEQELGNLLPATRSLATILTMIEVDPSDPAFDNPTKPIGPVYDEATARRLSAERGWSVAPDGDRWRRVVASPQPLEIMEAQVLGFLVERGVIVICAGGGGIPVVRLDGGVIAGVEAVIDKDLASSLLARQLDADMLLMLTDVDAVYLDWGTPKARALRRVTADDIAARDFPAGSMGPKVEAAIAFATATGKPAAIGSLEDPVAIVAGRRGTRIEPAGPSVGDEASGAR